jgi:hypothetical protein
VLDADKDHDKTGEKGEKKILSRATVVRLGG